MRVKKILKLLMNFKSRKAQRHRDEKFSAIRRGIRQKLRRKEWLGLAPFGYQNNPLKRNIETHPTEARIVKLAFEEYTKGAHSFISLAQFLADLGVVSKNGTPLAKASIKRLLTHRAYIGFVKHKGEWFDGSFEPIISPALFEAVQKILRTKERPRHRRARHDFPFTGLFRCAECGSMISAQWAVNRWGTKYRYYRCSKKRGRCSQPYIQEAELARQIKARLQTISLCDNLTDWMLEKVKVWEREEVGASQSEVQNLSTQIKTAEAKMEKLVSTYLDGDIPKATYLKKKDEILLVSAVFEQKKKDFENGRKNWVEPLQEWILDTKQADFLAKSDNFHEIKSFVQKIGTNPRVRNKSAVFDFCPASQFAAKRRAILRSAAALRPRGATLSNREVSIGGGGGIRTLGTVSRTQTLQVCRLNHSRTPPKTSKR